MSLGTLRGILMGKLARYRSLGLSCVASCLGVLEFLLELHLLGYPPWTLRALSHSLPNSAAVRSARESLRGWLRHRQYQYSLIGEMGPYKRKKCPDQAWEPWWGPRGDPSQTQPRGPPEVRDDDRDSPRGHHQDSSSSSVDGTRQARLDKAQQYLAKHNDE